MAWRTHLLETLTGQHERPQLPNTNKCDADRRTTVVLGVRSRDPGREARLGGGGLSKGPLWNRPPVECTELVPCPLLSWDDTMVLAQKQRPQSPHTGTACSLGPDTLEPNGCRQAGLAVISPSGFPLSSQRTALPCHPAPPYGRSQEMVSSGLLSTWRLWSPAAQKRCQLLAFPGVSYSWPEVPRDVALSTTSCLAPNPRTYTSQPCTQTSSLHPCCPVCLKTPWVGSKLPPPHYLTA